MRLRNTLSPALGSIAAVLLAFAPLASAARNQTDPPTAGALTDQARGLLPRYDGETKTSLSTDELPTVRAAA